MITQVPELADGGFWYVVPIINDPELGSVPDLPAGTPWAQWRNDGVRAVVRTPHRVDVQEQFETVEAALAHHKKPYARAGGR